jgi:hypothetical protein
MSAWHPGVRQAEGLGVPSFTLQRIIVDDEAVYWTNYGLRAAGVKDGAVMMVARP